MQAVLQVFSKPPKILPARGLRLNKKVQNLNVFMKKVKCGANHGKNWAKLTKYASCTSGQYYLLSNLRSYLLEVQDQMKKIEVNVHL